MFVLSLNFAGGVEKLTQITSTSLAGDMIGALLIVSVILIYGFLLDRHNMLINLSATYFAVLAMNFFPFQSWGIGKYLQTPLGQLILFAAAVLSVSIILSATHLFRIVYAKNFVVRWFVAAVNGFCYGGLLVSILVSILPASFLSQFSAGFLNFFISDTASFLWLAAPLAGMIITKSGRTRGRPSY